MGLTGNPIRCPRCGAWALASASKGIWCAACKNGTARKEKG